MNAFLSIFLGVILMLMVISMILFWKFNLKNTTKKEETTLKGIKEFSPLIIAYVGIIVTVIPYFISEEKIPVFFPEYEDKISEIDKLKKENSELKTIIADQTKEKNKLSEKNKDLSKKNYAELSKISLVLDGLPVNDGNTVIADVNDTLYYNVDILRKITSKDVSYDEDTKTVYIGFKGEQKITKQALSEEYSILYGGDNYKSLKDSDEDYHVGGEIIKDGFIFEGYSFTENIALFNTNNKFTKIEFDIGKIDESTSSLNDAKMKIELNGEKKYQETVRADITSHHYEFDITDAKTLKIELAETSLKFGVYNIVFTK